MEKKKNVVGDKSDGLVCTNWASFCTVLHFAKDFIPYMYI